MILKFQRVSYLIIINNIYYYIYINEIKYIYIFSKFKNNSLKGIQIIHIFENF